jgi:hypothetical protein
MAKRMGQGERSRSRNHLKVLQLMSAAMPARGCQFLSSLINAIKPAIGT